MTGPIELVPLECRRCRSRLPAEPAEVAWLCSSCGQGQRLDEKAELQTVDVRFAKAREGQPVRWLPFWVMPARVQIVERSSYGRDQAPDPRWAEPQQFVLPAFDTLPEEAGKWGARFLREPVRLEAGPAEALSGVTVTPEEAQALAEFVVLTIEAERRDKIKSVRALLDFGEAELWCLPFAGSGGESRLALAA